MEKKQLGVIFGSRSCEHEVSIISALQMMKAADPERYEIVPIYISMSGEWFTGAPLLDIKTYQNFDGYREGLIRVWLDPTAGSGALMTLEPPKGLFKPEKQRLAARLDCVIPVLHGMHGEDGTLQGTVGTVQYPIRELRRRGFRRWHGQGVHEGIFSGAADFRCSPAAGRCKAGGKRIRTRWSQILRERLIIPYSSNPPRWVRPSACRRRGIREELQDALALAFKFDRKALIEQGLENPLELNCSVLGYNDDVTASAIEMPVTGGDLLSFMDKYLQGGKSAGKGMASPETHPARAH